LFFSFLFSNGYKNYMVKLLVILLSYNIINLLSFKFVFNINIRYIRNQQNMMTRISANYKFLFITQHRILTMHYSSSIINTHSYLGHLIDIITYTNTLIFKHWYRQIFLFFSHKLNNINIINR